MDKYLAEFLNLPLDKLLKSYNTIELALMNELTEEVGRTLSTKGFQKHGETYSKGNIHLAIITDFLKNGRSVHLSIHNIAKRTSKTLSEVPIDHFGLIRKICLELPYPTPIPPDSLINSLKREVISAYTALEQSFISNATTLERKVFRKLYDCIEYQLKMSHKLHLLGRFWLFISEIDEGYYFFDEHILRKVIEFYKTHQDEILSPMELTVWIMTAPLPWEKSLAVETWRQKKVLSLPWLKARYIGQADKIFRAEFALYDSDDYVGLTILEKRGYYLVVGLPTDIQQELMPEIEAAKKLLADFFEQGLREWSPYLKLVKAISNLREESSVASFIGTTLGEAAARFLKSIGEP